MEKLDTIFDFDLAKLDEFDLIFINVADDKPNYVDALIDAIGTQRKEYMAVLLLLHSDKELRRVVAKLDYWSVDVAVGGPKKSTMDVVQLLFEKGPGAKNQKKQNKLIEENVQYGILFGRFHVFHPPLQVLNKELNLSLKNVLSNICPPLSSIAYVQTGKQDIISIHDQDDTGSGSSVTYFAPNQSLEKFLLGPASKVKLGMDIQHAQEVVENDDEDSKNDDLDKEDDFGIVNDKEAKSSEERTPEDMGEHSGGLERKDSTSKC